MNNWNSNAGMVRHYAALMTDAELAWFTTIDRDPRKTPDNALRLRDLHVTLARRSSDQCRQQIAEQRRGNIERLKRLGLDSDTEAEAQPR
jgi:hypothetical protein